MMKFLLISSFLLLVCVCTSSAQQIPDLDFKYENKQPLYPKSKGPVITLDEAHLTFLTLEGRYSPFGKPLADDGYD